MNSPALHPCGRQGCMWSTIAQPAVFPRALCGRRAAADALVLKVLKVREGGRVVNMHALVTTGVNADGHREIHREILGVQGTSGEDGAGWLGSSAT